MTLNVKLFTRLPALFITLILIYFHPSLTDTLCTPTIKVEFNEKSPFTFSVS